jgi:MFS transporter, DHA2 family, multidrug resistance protein
MNSYVPYGDLKGGRLMLAAFVLALANFMVVLDMTIANVSVPHITGFYCFESEAECYE